MYPGRRIGRKIESRMDRNDYAEIYAEGVMPMTIEESKQIHYITKEIETIKRDMAELRMKNPYKENIITDISGDYGNAAIC